jgi:hypothetical protein
LKGYKQACYVLCGMFFLYKVFLDIPQVITTLTRDPVSFNNSSAKSQSGCTVLVIKMNQAGEI